MAENVREIVLDILIALEKEDHFSNQLIKAVLDKYDYLDTRDKGFIKRVTEGSIERQIEIDYCLNQLSNVPVKKMKPLIRCLLRMSVYQIVYMDSVPDSAVCNEACKLAAKRKFGSLKGFVNGVLRNVSRQKDNLPRPDKQKELAAWLSVEYSMPKWLVDMWIANYGETVSEKLLQALLQVHPVSARFVSTLSDKEQEKIIAQIEETGAKVTGNGYVPYAFTLENCDNIASLPGFAEGKWTIQDVSSILAVEAAGIQKDAYVIDACAAPGGKSILAAEKGKRVLSRDLTDEKIARIEENANRMGTRNIRLQQWDATLCDDTMQGKADVLLLDVPCSGLGIIGKKRDIKYRLTQEGLDSLCELQKQIVKSSIGYLKDGGILVYSTCTIHGKENEEMVKYLCDTYKLKPVDLQGRVPERLLEERDAVRKAVPKGRNASLEALTEEQRRACVQLLPGYMETDGFFFAVLEKTLE